MWQKQCRRRVIDLHCHILPGLDDGPVSLDQSLAMARAAQDEGILTSVATPHVRDDYPFELREIAVRTGELRRSLAEARIELRLTTGAEIALSKLPELDRETLGELCLGAGDYVLVESPYTYATDSLENMLFDLQLVGLHPILAHPERCPSFLTDIDRLTRLVDRGALCSITSASMAGRFGQVIQGFTVAMLTGGLVHNVASDAHDHSYRAPTLRAGFERLETQLPGILDQAVWFTSEVPEAILAGHELPAPPPRLRQRRTGRWKPIRRPRS
jgi:protein-tyrosine phosphatase